MSPISLDELGAKRQRICTYLKALTKSQRSGSSINKLMKKVRHIEEQEAKTDTSSGIISRVLSEKFSTVVRSNSKQACIASVSALVKEVITRPLFRINAILKEIFTETSEARYRHRSWSWNNDGYKFTRRYKNKNANYIQKHLVTILLVATLGFLISVIPSGSFANATRQAFAQEYLINSDQLGGSNRPRLGLLDQTTTTSDGILVQTKQAIFKGKLIESKSRYHRSASKVIGFLGKLLS